MTPDDARVLIAHALLDAYRVETQAPDDMIAMLAAIADVPPPAPRAPAPQTKRRKR